MQFVKHLYLLVGIGSVLLGGKPAAAQTVVPTQNPFHVVQQTAVLPSAAVGLPLTVHNTTGETIGLGLISLSGSASFPTFLGSDAFRFISFAPGETRTLNDLFRVGATGAVGTIGTLNYRITFNGFFSGKDYVVSNSASLVTDAPATVPAVPEPSTAALLLPALGAFPLWKLRRTKWPMRAR